MPRQRLINCDFFSVSGFTKNLSNKAKLIYFLFLVNADDMGFVGNGLDIAQNLDQCEETFDNVLFQFKYVDTLQELVDKRLVYEFSDKVGNKTYLIRHWFFHNKKQNYLSTNYVSYRAQVEIIDNEYHFKNHQRKEPYKEKEIKENKLNQNKPNIIEIKNKENDSWEKDWEDTLKYLNETQPKEN